MKQVLPRYMILLLVSLAVIPACVTMQPKDVLRIGEVTPGPGESVVVDQAVILADVSRSMWGDEKYSLEKAHPSAAESLREGLEEMFPEATG